MTVELHRPGRSELPQGDPALPPAVNLVLNLSDVRELLLHAAAIARQDAGYVRRERRRPEP